MSRIANTPFGRAIRVGRIGGVAVYAHWSLAILLGVLVMLLAHSTLPELVPGASTAGYWATAVVTAVVFVLSIAAHELAHALVARHFGIPVRRTTLWMLGGLTEMEGEGRSPRIDSLVAGAGPLTNLGLGLVCGVLASLVGPSTLAAAALAWLASVNIVLAVFNLLPGAPLDGGHLLRALLWRRTGDPDRARQVAGRVGRLVGDGIVVIAVLALLAGDPGGLWLALVGLFVIAGAREEGGVVSAGTGLRARDVMDPAPGVCPQWWTLGQFLASVGPDGLAQAAFPLVDLAGRATGALLPHDLELAARSHAATARVGDLHRGPPVPLVDADTPLDEVVRRIHFRGQVAVVIDDHGAPIGVVEERPAVRALRLARLPVQRPAGRDEPATTNP